MEFWRGTWQKGSQQFGPTLKTSESINSAKLSHCDNQSFLKKSLLHKRIAYGWACSLSGNRPPLTPLLAAGWCSDEVTSRRKSWSAHPSVNASWLSIVSELWFTEESPPSALTALLLEPRKFLWTSRAYCYPSGGVTEWISNAFPLATPFCLRNFYIIPGR